MEFLTRFRLRFKLVILLLTYIATLNAQEERLSWQAGSIGLYLGHGILNSEATSLRISIPADRPVKDIKSTGAFYGKLEFGISDRLTLGASFAYSQLDFSIWTPANTRYGTGRSEFRTWQVTVFTALFRFNYHYYISRKVSTYVGFGFGPKFITQDYPEYNMNFFPYLYIARTGFESTLGFRYVGASGIGLYGEMGLSRSLLQIGLTFNLKN